MYPVCCLRITARVATLSAFVSSLGSTTCTTGNFAGLVLSPPALAIARRRPKPSPVASRITELKMSLVALLREASHAGTMMIALKKIGPKNVAIRNHFDRTRSTYSRLMTAQSLAMSAHSLFDAGGADFLQEDLMQRWLNELEALNLRARLHDLSQQRLRIRAGRQLDLEEPIGIISAPDE